ncbi:MAG TPA: ribokinase [Armatimonadota bacterium]|jgi:ribokinase
MGRPKIVVVGSANTDLVVKVPQIPGPGETVLGGDLVRASGGKGANQAVAAARLGAEVWLVGKLGQDDFGATYLEGLRREGIHTEFVTVSDSHPSGVALIYVDERGENSIAVAAGANLAITQDDVEAAREVIAGADCLLTQLEVPVPAVKHALRTAKSAGVLTILNPAPAPTCRLEQSMLADVDILTPNRHEAATLSGGQGDTVGLAMRLLEMGVGVVLITLGADGAFAVTPKEMTSMPALTVEPVDSTGAGDCFNGALAHAISTGVTFQEAIRFASSAAAFSVTRLGAQPSFPTAAELQAFLEQRPDTRPQELLNP